jgi:hypothetical protein
METCRIKGREPALHNSNGEAQAHWHSGGRRMGESLAGLCTGFKYIEINILSESECIQNAG